MSGPATANMALARVGEAGGDLIDQAEHFGKTGKNPTANRVPRGKEVGMSTINEYLHSQADLIPSGVRTGAVIVAAGIATGSLVYFLSILVGSWA
jgi:hypothetical protein